MNTFRSNARFIFLGEYNGNPTSFTEISEVQLNRTFKKFLFHTKLNTRAVTDRAALNGAFENSNFHVPSLMEFRLKRYINYQMYPGNASYCGSLNEIETCVFWIVFVETCRIIAGMINLTLHTVVNCRDIRIRSFGDNLRYFRVVRSDALGKTSTPAIASFN